MPRKATGTTFADRTGRRYARVRVGPGPKDRRAFQLPQGLLAAGDLGGARVAHQALGALLGEAGPVVDLVDRRRR